MITGAPFHPGQSVRILPLSYELDIKLGVEREDIGGWPGVILKSDTDPDCYSSVDVDGERWIVSHDRIVAR